MNYFILLAISSLIIGLIFTLIIYIAKNKSKEIINKLGKRLSIFLFITITLGS